MSTPNPMADTFPDSDPSQVSKRTFLIAGILVTVLGLEEVPTDASLKEVSCLWLLHPRLLDQKCMEPFGRHVVRAWNARYAKLDKSQRKGLIAVSFDQRNHGSRLQHTLANEAWRGGNDTHAPDMFTTFQGTANDMSQLITHLGSYISPDGRYQITSHTVLGVSLGGYAAWHSLLHDTRVDAAIIVVGCADYKRIMTDRARLSKRDTWRDGGKGFIGSKDFPPDLVRAVDESDPAALLMGEMFGDMNPVDSDLDFQREPTDAEKKKLTPLMRDHLHGKRIFNMAGGDDKLVPYECSRPFLQWLKKAVGPGGWAQAEGTKLEDKVYPGVGHAMSPEMRDDALRWLLESSTAGRGFSKI